MNNPIHFVGLTHPGNRDHNEDVFAVDDTLGIALIADGMGGYACGEVASALIRDTLLDAAQKNEGLTEAIARAHKSVKEESARDDGKHGMGSTVIALKSRALDYEIAWVGDSRGYLWDGQLKQITRDHSYIEALLATGAITAAQAIKHPNRNLITQAVGAAGAEGLEISVIHGRLCPGQRILLCSDGLVDEVSDGQIAAILHAEQDPERAVQVLVEQALQAGGRDNITVVLAEVAAGIASPEEQLVPYVICTTTVEGASERHDVLPINDSGEFASVGTTAGHTSFWRSLIRRLRGME